MTAMNDDRDRADTKRRHPSPTSLSLERPGSAGTPSFYTNMTIAQVSWVNLADSERGSPEHGVRLLNRDLSDISLVIPAAADQIDLDDKDVTENSEKKTANRETVLERYPEYAYIVDKATGKRIFYKRVDDQREILIERRVSSASSKIEMAFLVASNLVIFALGYSCWLLPYSLTTTCDAVG
jgi:hypothetical protein